MNKTIKKIVGFIIFIIITMFVYAKLTYLFREPHYNRHRITGIKQVDVDVVYIDGSDVHAYWSPMKAWADYGWTTYDYSTDALPFQNIVNYIDESLKYQDPELYIIGVRTIFNILNEQDEGAIRDGTDSMDIMSINRIQMIEKFFAVNKETELDRLTLYLEFLNYHTNTVSFRRESSWELINNDAPAEWMGFQINYNIDYYEKPDTRICEGRYELTENQEKYLYEILDYCKSHELNVLFVVSPYVGGMAEDAQETYNTISDIVAEYGYNFLNANYYYDEMNLDFAVDFCDSDHVNFEGSIKYMDFLEEYLNSNYVLGDHRNEREYEEWDELYFQYLECLDEHTR